MRLPTARTLPRPARIALRWGLALAVLVAVGFVVRDRFGAVSAADVPLPAAWAVAAAMVTFVVANELLVRGWLHLTRMGGADLTRRLARWVWAKSQLARYAVAMAQVPTRAVVARQHGMAAATGAITTLLEVVWYTCINAVMVMATIPWWLPGTGLAWAGWLAVAPGLLIVLALVSPQTFVHAVLLLGRLPVLRRIGAIDRARELRVERRDTAALTGLYVGNATIRLAGFLALFVGVGGGTDDLLRATGAFALGHLIGALAVFAPGGLGAREGVTALALAPVIGGGPVLMLVAATRLLELAAELLYAGFSRWRWSLYVQDHPEAEGEDVGARTPTGAPAA